MSGWLGSFASVNTMAMRVVSAATTNGPRSFRKLSTSDSAAFCSVDLFSSLGTSDVLFGQADAELWLIVLTHRRQSKLHIDGDQPGAQSALYSVVLPSKCSLSASASARVW